MLFHKNNDQKENSWLKPRELHKFLFFLAILIFKFELKNIRSSGVLSQLKGLTSLSLS